MNPYISFLHTEQVGKPTLTFDLIEEFRQPVVDKAILGMIRKRENLTMEGTGLSHDTKDRVVKHVMKKLNTKVRFRGGRIILRQVIKHQASSMAKFLQGKENYRPFLDKW